MAYSASLDVCWLRVEWVRELVAEMIGTWVLICFGCGCVAQSVLSGGNNGGMLSINLGWGIGVTMAALISGSVSGAHLNPAVSLALAAVGQMSPSKLFHYMAGQYIGAFAGAATVFLVYMDALNYYALEYTGGEWLVDGENATAGIFATYPAPGVTNLGGAVDQVVGTALLLVCLLAIGDPANSKLAKSLGPVLAGLAVTNIGICFGHNCGYAINPARDLSPRIFTAMAGWGWQVFSSHQGWWWIPVVCSHLGGLLGAILYTVAIKINTAHAIAKRQEEKEQSSQIVLKKV